MDDTNPAPDPALATSPAAGALANGRTGLLQALQGHRELIKGAYTPLRARVVDTSPLTIQYGGNVIPAMGIRGLTYEAGDLVMCLKDGRAGLPIALPLTRTP